MTRGTTFLGLTVIGLVIISCNRTDSKREAELKSIDLIRGEITLCGNQEFGDVNFSVFCSSESRASFNLGISLLHSFEYEEAEKAFVKTIDMDPNCAMAYWGVAMSNFHSLWLQSGTKHLEKGSKVLAIAQSLPKSEREQDYLNAIHIFYKDWESIDHNKRKVLFENEMEKLVQKYPEDKEAAIFYALALSATANPADKNYENQKKAGKILESLFKNQPNHPGIAHYIIHTYDYPELAASALTIARKYAKIAPSSAHAQHMPSHIFTRLGLWEESITSNINSTTSARCYSQSIDTTAHWDEELHGMDYLVYAYLQIGDNAKAEEQLHYLRSFKKVFPINFKVAYATAAIPSRIVLENKNWSEAANLQFPTVDFNWDDFPWEKSILNFTRGIGAARAGEVASAKKELEILKTAHQRLSDSKEIYKANQVDIQCKSVEAWIHLATGDHKQAIAFMEEANKLEHNTSKHAVTPGEVVPATELLGDLYMEMGNPAKALVAYELDLQQHQNRFNGIYGAAKAAAALKDKNKATKYYQLLLSQTKSMGEARKEITEAKKFIGI